MLSHALLLTTSLDFVRLCCTYTNTVIIGVDLALHNIINTIKIHLQNIAKLYKFSKKYRYRRLSATNYRLSLSLNFFFDLPFFAIALLVLCIYQLSLSLNSNLNYRAHHCIREYEHFVAFIKTII